MPSRDHEDYPIRRRSEDNTQVAPLAKGEIEAIRAALYGLQSRDEGESENTGGGGFPLRDILYIIFRHKWKILMIFLACSVGSVLFVATSRNMYQSEGRIFIRGDRITYSVDPTGENNSFVKGDKGGSVQARSEMALMASTRVAARVVDEIGVDGVLSAATAPPTKAKKLSFVDQALASVDQFVNSASKHTMAFLGLTPIPQTAYEAAVQSVVGHMEVAPSSGGSNVLIVTYTSYKPETAKRILDALLKAYVEVHIEIHKSQVPAAFFKSKSDELKLLLDAKEKALDARRKELNITSLASQKEMTLNGINAAETRLNDTEAELSSSRARASAIKKRLDDPNGASTFSSGTMAVSLDPETAAIRDRIVKLRIDEVDLRSRYREGSAMLVNIRDQIKRLENALATNKPSANPALRSVDPVRQGLVLQYDTENALANGLAARQAKLAATATELRAQLSKLTSHEQEIAQLERDVNIVEAEYRQYLNGVQASEISDALDRNNVSSVSILQNATRPTTTVRSQKKTLALMSFGVFMGLVLGLGLAVSLEYLDHSFKTIEDLEKALGVPVLISLPSEKNHKPVLREEAV